MGPINCAPNPQAKKPQLLVCKNAVEKYGASSWLLRCLLNLAPNHHYVYVPLRLNPRVGRQMGISVYQVLKGVS